MSDLISRQAVLDALEESGYCYNFWIDIENIINSLPSAELRKITQESTQDLISRADAIEVLMETIAPPSVTLDTLVMRIDALPSAEPQPKPISYIECANAMLKMWIDNVLTDGEYYRIMEKLNSKHMADMRSGSEA